MAAVILLGAMLSVGLGFALLASRGQICICAGCISYVVS